MKSEYTAWVEANHTGHQGGFRHGQPSKKLILCRLKWNVLGQFQVTRRLCREYEDRTIEGRMT